LRWYLSNFYPRPSTRNMCTEKLTYRMRYIPFYFLYFLLDSMMNERNSLCWNNTEQGTVWKQWFSIWIQHIFFTPRVNKKFTLKRIPRLQNKSWESFSHFYFNTCFLYYSVEWKKKWNLFIQLTATCSYQEKQVLATWDSISVSYVSELQHVTLHKEKTVILNMNIAPW